MLSALDVANFKSDLVTAGTTTAKPVGPMESRLDPSSLQRSAIVDFTGRLPDEGHVRPQRVVPDCVQSNLSSHGFHRQRNEKAPSALLLHGSDESFDNRDARGFTNTPVAGPDAPTLAPALETAAPELCALVGDDVLGCGPARPDRTIKEALDLVR